MVMLLNLFREYGPDTDGVPSDITLEVLCHGAPFFHICWLFVAQTQSVKHTYRFMVQDGQTDGKTCFMVHQYFNYESKDIEKKKGMTRCRILQNETMVNWYYGR